MKICLTHCTDEEMEKLGRLVNVYTLNNMYLQGVSDRDFNIHSSTFYSLLYKLVNFKIVGL